MSLRAPRPRNRTALRPCSQPFGKAPTAMLVHTPQPMAMLNAHGRPATGRAALCGPTTPGYILRPQGPRPRGCTAPRPCSQPIGKAPKAVPVHTPQPMAMLNAQGRPATGRTALHGPTTPSYTLRPKGPTTPGLHRPKVVQPALWQSTKGGASAHTTIYGHARCPWSTRHWARPRYMGPRPRATFCDPKACMKEFLCSCLFVRFNNL